MFTLEHVLEVKLAIINVMYQIIVIVSYLKLHMFIIQASC